MNAELGQTTSPGAAAGEGRIIALSARNEPELRRFAGSLRDWLSRGRGGISLDELSRSLNVGRAHFGVRFCGVFDSLDGLSAALEQRAAGAAPRPGGAERARRALEDAVSVLGERGAGPGERRAALEAVCDWYREGAEVDWRRVCGEPTAVDPLDLPAYPFTEVDFWLSTGEACTEIGGGRSGTADSFWDADVSRLGRQGFAKLLGDDDARVLQHRVLGVPLVHAAFHLELALAALKALRCPVEGVRLRSAVWANHVVLGRRAPVCAWVQGEGDAASFEIGLGGEATEEVVMQGQWEAAGGAPGLPSPAMPPAGFARERLTAAEVYDALAACGIEYGPEARLIGAVEVASADDAWAEISPPAPPEDGREPVPRALLAAIQAAEFLRARSAEAPAVVESIGSVIVAAAGRDPRFVRVRSNTASGRSYDIAVLDEQREVVVLFEQALFQRVGGARGAGDRRGQGAGGPVLARPRLVARASDAVARSSARGGVLIFDTDDRLARRLRESEPEANVTVVLPGADFRRDDAGTFSIDVTRGDHYAALFEALRGAGVVPQHFVHRWARGDFEYRAGRIEGQLDRGVRSLYWMARALVAARWDSPVQILSWYGGRPELAQPLGASAAGLLRSFALEHAHTSVRVLEDAWSEDDPAKAEVVLRSEIAIEAGDVEVRRDRDGRWAKIYEPAPASPGPAPPPVRAHGTYLVTGGLGGLGRMFAERFARLAPVNLVLAGRSAPTPQQEEFLARCRAAGSRVTFARCDVSREDEVSGLVERARAEYGPLHGVLHAAGVLRDGLVATKGLDALNEVLAPKIAGTVHLDVATRREPLDFFVMFSSLVGVAGNVGQADYAAANAFQLSFAELRDAQRATSERSGITRAIAWGYWQRGGMRVAEDMDAALAARGLDPITDEVGFALFDEALRAEAPALIAAQGSSSRLLSQLTGADRG